MIVLSAISEQESHDCSSKGRTCNGHLASAVEIRLRSSLEELFEVNDLSGELLRECGCSCRGCDFPTSSDHEWTVSEVNIFGICVIS